MLKKHKYVTPESIQELSACFSSIEEVAIFLSQLHDLATEITSISKNRDRASEIDAIYCSLRQMCLFTLFCRDHIELMHQLIKAIKIKELTDEELDEIQRLEG